MSPPYFLQIDSSPLPGGIITRLLYFMPNLAQICSLISAGATADWKSGTPPYIIALSKKKPSNRVLQKKGGKRKKDMKRINVILFRYFFAMCHLRARVSTTKAVLSELLAGNWGEGARILFYVIIFRSCLKSILNFTVESDIKKGNIHCMELCLAKECRTFLCNFVSFD